MKKKLNFILAICMVCIIFLSTAQSEEIGCIKAYAITTQEKLDAAKDEYEQTKDNLADEKDNLSELEEEKTQLEESLEDLNEDLQAVSDVLEELEIQINSTSEQIDMTWGRIEELSTQIDETRQASEERYELLKAHIKFIYETGDNLNVLLLCASSSYSDYINRSSFVSMLSEYEQTQLEELKKAKDELIEKQDEYGKALVEYEEEKASLDEYKELQLEELSKVEELIDSTSVKVSSYDDRIEEAQVRMLDYEKQLNEQEDNIEELKNQIEEEKRISQEAKNAGWSDISDVTTTQGDRKLLANIIYCEAGNEPYVGQVAVGAVVMNRVRSEVFPNTIVGVIYQKRQFSPVASGRLALALAKDSADENCYKAADAALSGVTNVGDCLYFRTPTSSVTPKYTIGGHIFY